MAWNPSGWPLAAAEELGRERSPAWSHNRDGPRSCSHRATGFESVPGDAGMGPGDGNQEEPTLELMALTFI